MLVEVQVEGEHRCGATSPGESLLAAARRLAPEASDVVPLDLSRDPPRWTVVGDTVVALRAMTRGDLPLVVRWRGQPHVDRWWHTDGPATLEAVTTLYSPDIDGETPKRMWVIEVNGRSIGFVQDYRIGDYPDYALLAPDPEAIGCDYLVGEPLWIGRGIGTLALWTWARLTSRLRPEATSFFAAPDHRNAASLRVLDKVGFVQGTWFDELEPDGSRTTVVGCSLDVRRVLGATGAT